MHRVSAEILFHMVLSLVFDKKGKDNRLQHIIHVVLFNQVTLYTTKSLVLGVIHLPRDLANVYAWKPMYALKVEFMRKMS